MSFPFADLFFREMHFLDGISSFRFTSCRKEAVLWQVEGSSLFQSLISLTSHENDDVAKYSERLLFDLSEEDFYRPKLGNAGAIDWLVRKVEGPWENRVQALNTLCLFCQEAVNRVKLRDVGALELFLNVLSNADYAVLHYRIISALYCFVYWKEALERLVCNGLVSRLVDFVKESAALGNETLLEKLMRERVESSQSNNSIESESEEVETEATSKKIKLSHYSPMSSCDVQPTLSEGVTNIFDAWRQRRAQSESEWSGSGLGSPGSSPSRSGCSSASPPPDAVYSPSQSPTRMMGRFDGVHLNDDSEASMYPHSSSSSPNPSFSPLRNVSPSSNRELGEALPQWVYSSESDSDG